MDYNLQVLASLREINRIMQEHINSYGLLVTTRRHFLLESAAGLGAFALANLLGSCAGAPKDTRQKMIAPIDPMAAKPPHFPGKAKRVIFMHMAGAPSQLELFDYKPELKKLDNQLCPQSLLDGKRFAFIRGVPRMLGPQAVFKQRGQSGAYVSENLPHFAGIADEVSFLKAVHTDQFNHAPAQLLVHSGSPRLGRPSMGSWITYGLGTENQNLPGFVVLAPGLPIMAPQIWNSAFLPASYQGTWVNTEHSDPKKLFLE